MNIVVFSKDRAAQLDLFLRSMEEYFAEYNYFKVNVLYTFSNDSFYLGYESLFDLHPGVNFVRETNFKNDLVSLISDYEYTVFFVDDIIWKDKFSIRDKEFSIFENSTNIDKKVLCLSLRINPDLNYCYTANIPMKKPKFFGGGMWEWKGASGDYGYPMSLDGHIFRTKEIKPYLQKLNYKNPNNLEGILASVPLANPYMLCYENSKIVNNPANKVQTNNPNKHGNISAEYLNDKFLDGYMIDLEPFKGLKNTQCHMELPITFIEDDR